MPVTLTDEEWGEVVVAVTTQTAGFGSMMTAGGRISDGLLEVVEALPDPEPALREALGKQTAGLEAVAAGGRVCRDASNVLVRVIETVNGRLKEKDGVYVSGNRASRRKRKT